MNRSVSVKSETHTIGSEDEWVAIQNRTFVNWVNEQLTACGRQVTNLDTDLCDGVNLVALVESLQFRKIGKVYAKSKSRIQMIQNVNLAFQAITDDNIRLVNIGNEDVVNGNLKLILGLLWHLILRYQISSSKTKAPPKKLMMSWLSSVLPDLKIKNFSSDWSDGIALHALLELCRPGTSPNWKSLQSKNRVDNCRTAMTLAKDLLNIPIMISPEDFASSALDEMSAMTYLSYFIKRDSPGYYSTLNWVCRQLRTTTVSNLSTDWNDGYYLCGVVHSIDGNIPNWPNLDRNDYITNCKMGIDEATRLGIEPILTPEEMADPNVDHLVIMAYLSKFQNYKPLEPVVEIPKIVIKSDFKNVLLGKQLHFKIGVPNEKVEKTKIKVEIKSKSRTVICNPAWKEGNGEYLFIPKESGNHSIHLYYDDIEMPWSPRQFNVELDLSSISATSSGRYSKINEQWQVKIDVSKAGDAKVTMISTNPVGKTADVSIIKDNDIITGSIRPTVIGSWTVCIYVNGQNANKDLTFQVFNPDVCVLTGPDYLMVGEAGQFSVEHSEDGNDMVELYVFDANDKTTNDVDVSSTKHNTKLTFCPQHAGKYKVVAKMYGKAIKGSPVILNVNDSSQVVASGDGLNSGTKGEKATFNINTNNIRGNIAVSIKVNNNNNNKEVNFTERQVVEGCYEYDYIPHTHGTYTINITVSGLPVTGSPFNVQVTDQSSITMVTDLEDLKDENGLLVLDFKEDTKLQFNVANAGPGKLKSEILSPSGKKAAKVEQNDQTATVTFQAEQKGDHYIHIYWNDAPLAFSPVVGYCDGSVLPVDHFKVTIIGDGSEKARKDVTAQFTVDGRLAGPGKCRVELKGVHHTVDVKADDIKYNRYRCTYTSHNTGGFLLYVYWSDILVPSCPLKVSIGDKGAAAKVTVSGDGLHGGIVGEELQFVVDTTLAGAGEITALCKGQHQNAQCDVKDEQDGTFKIWVRPTEPGKYLLVVLFDGTEVPGSPFVVRVGEPPDASKVKAFGPGIENGLIYNYQSRFLVETHGAGAGKLSVRIRGPKGAFKAEMKREGRNDRTILCYYDPSEPGEYTITIFWSGTEIPGSPVTVRIFESRDELLEFEHDNGDVIIENDQWRTEI